MNTSHGQKRCPVWAASHRIYIIKSRRCSSERKTAREFSKNFFICLDTVVRQAVFAQKRVDLEQPL